MTFLKLRAKTLHKQKKHEDLFLYLAPTREGLEFFFSIMKHDDTLALWYAKWSSGILNEIFTNPETTASAQEFCQENGSEDIFDFIKSGHDLRHQSEKENRIIN